MLTSLKLDLTDDILELLLALVTMLTFLALLAHV